MSITRNAGRDGAVRGSLMTRSAFAVVTFVLWFVAVACCRPVYGGDGGAGDGGDTDARRDSGGTSLLTGTGGRITMTTGMRIRAGPTRYECKAVPNEGAVGDALAGGAVGYVLFGPVGGLLGVASADSSRRECREVPPETVRVTDGCAFSGRYVDRKRRQRAGDGVPRLGVHWDGAAAGHHAALTDASEKSERP